ncbi:hypothetical protein N7U66_00025 [Lacinutrix neustonica]|uniref:Uncharacterized protein n=1 Tax=Lacinutrix neustonica TaxID=2980107 RepID=A0A9E8SH04_9FLAO|nr:hypothetical protein [Lacinutrix neustonica]WAC02214.1 hypothetical protein N7U66_21090 [Lacinutrix neustonica]WAC02225.1 hypothetical protein N7U66_00025 [Lacinutrix neustonica]
MALITTLPLAEQVIGLAVVVTAKAAAGAFTVNVVVASQLVAVSVTTIV